MKAYNYLKNKVLKKVFLIFCAIFLGANLIVINNSYAAQDNDNVKIITENSIENKNEIKLENVKKIVDKKNKENVIDSKEKVYQEKEEDPINQYGLKMLRSLGIVIGVLFLILAFVKKVNFSKNAIERIEKIQILEKKNVSAKAMLVLAEVESQKVLVGISGDSISMISIDDKKHFEDLLDDKITEEKTLVNDKKAK